MRRMIVPVLGSALMLAGAASPAVAQDVEYTTIGKVELSGALGTVMRLFGGGDETSEKTYIKGAMMRTDSDKSSTIMDLENGRVISIDHDAKTYTIMTFAQMTQMMERAVTDAKAEAARETGASPSESEPEPEVTLDYRLSVDQTGERQTINGYEAERYVMTMETEATVTEEGGEAQEAGRLVVLSDMWNAENVPIADAMATFYQQAPELAARNQQAMQSMAAAFATNPDLESAMEEASKEAGKMKGFTLRSTTYMVLVPAGMELDRAAVLEPKKKEEESGAKRALGGLLRGAIGGNREAEKSEAEAAPTQAVVATILNETKDMKTTSLSSDLFQPPAGYTEKPLQLPGS